MKRVRSQKHYEIYYDRLSCTNLVINVFVTREYDLLPRSEKLLPSRQKVEVKGNEIGGKVEGLDTGLYYFTLGSSVHTSM